MSLHLAEGSEKKRAARRGR